MDGRATLLLHVKSTVLACDAQTGKELWTYDLGSRPIEAPHLSDLDGDGQPDALFVYRRARESDELLLRAVSLKSRAILWEQPFLIPGYLNQDEWRLPGAELAAVADLDGDGKPEIVIPVRDDWGKTGKHWFGLEVRAGATGHTLWQRRLRSMGFSMSSGSGGATPVRFVVGPDLDGDGHRELFVASLGAVLHVPQADEHFLQVDALSGKNGAVLWRWLQKSAADPKPFEPSGRLQWWQASQDGWPLLVVPVKGAGGQPITFILAAGTGRLTQLLPEVADPQIADVNGDGIPDLFHLAATQGSRRLTVVKGAPPVDWRRTGDWQPASDYDGDGIPEFREWRTTENSQTLLAARSGVDGRILWQSNIRPDTNSNPRRRIIDVDDINGDAIPDIVLLEQLSTRGDSHAVSAFSGRDGHRLWTAGDFGLKSGSSGSSGGGPQMEYSYPMLDQQDLDGDGRPEILVAAHIDYYNGIQLAALSRTDGHLLWKVPILPGAYTGSSLIDRHIWHDLDGDGVLDIILWGPKSTNEHGVDVGSELRAVSGRDGKPLWTQTPHLAHEWFWWPRTAIADLDGDGAPEVVVTTHDYKGQNEMAVLEARSGQFKWNFSGQFGGYGGCWPPLLVDMDGDGRRMICLGVQESTATGTTNNVLVLDPSGEVRQKMTIGGWIGAAIAWMAFDADGDGKEELLYVNDAELHAYRGSDQRDLWKRPTGSYGLRFDELRAGRKDQPSTLITWSDRTVQGLNVATGATRWRCDVPRQDEYQLVANLIHANNPADLPLVVSHDSQ
ncbi:MAG TPA: VCBS repeat-containing protein, partial [Planctomycetaceae bacterium]